MTMIPLSVAEELTGKSTSWISAQCRSGMIANARKERLLNGRGAPGWIVDLDELYQVAAGIHPVEHPGEPWSPIIAAPPGDLTEVQHSAIANEYWHDLVDIQPDPAAPGAVHLRWSDGESFVLHPNGESSNYSYRRTWAYKRKLPEDEDLLVLAQSHTEAEIAEMYGATVRTVHVRLIKIYADLQHAQRG